MLSRMTKLIVITFLTLATLSGCNTTRGFGEDVQHLGGKISHAASK
ncbi:entericidin A/B family lipoprotein [Sodalis ligni]|jgi:entericidin A|uniref:Entericidin A n=1 Tax=Sodalis ligni TaxID=2697027 RepID=A0A4R1NPL5_9GAMM|nr:entericidin A/B family lipoprotein [Sodalis ligni]QWA10317.1 entericidin A/B family lipoprotein [Sodalis ligni]TCL06310.1 entericidin A [Sodalis ligni]